MTVLEEEVGRSKRGCYPTESDSVGEADMFVIASLQRGFK